MEAGLIPPLIQLLNSSDQEVLLQTGRALGNICYDSRESPLPPHLIGPLFPHQGSGSNNFMGQGWLVNGETSRCHSLKLLSIY